MRVQLEYGLSTTQRRYRRNRIAYNRDRRVESLGCDAQERRLTLCHWHELSTGAQLMCDITPKFSNPQRREKWRAERRAVAAEFKRLVAW